jgi:hypothetical protein
MRNVCSANGVLFTLTAVSVLVLVDCSNVEQAQNDTTGANESTQGSSEQTNQEEEEGRHLDLNVTTMEAFESIQDFTTIMAEVPYAPIPFAGSDGQTHLVYELAATNFTSGETTIEQLEVLDADTGDVIDALDAEEVAGPARDLRRG